MAKQQDPTLMKIGELAERAGVTPQTIRYYERLGLLGSLARVARGHRHYEEEALQRLKKIDALKGLGLSLEEIAQVIDLYFEDSTGLKGKQRVLQMLEEHLHDTDQRLEALFRFRSELVTGINRMRDLIREIEGP